MTMMGLIFGLSHRRNRRAIRCGMSKIEGACRAVMMYGVRRFFVMPTHMLLDVSKRLVESGDCFSEFGVGCEFRRIMRNSMSVCLGDGESGL